MRQSEEHALAEYNSDVLKGRVHTREHRGRMKLLQAQFDIERGREIGLCGDDWSVLRQYRSQPPGRCYAVQR